MANGNQVWMRAFMNPNTGCSQVEAQTRPIAGFQHQFLAVPIPADLKTAARLHAAQHAHQSLRQPVGGDNLARDRLLVRLAGRQVRHGAVRDAGGGQRRLFQPLTDLLDVPPKVLQQDLVRAQVALHSVRVRDRAQRAPKDEPVEPGQHAHDLLLVSRDKLVHGVSGPPRIFVSWLTDILRDPETPSSCAAPTGPSGSNPRPEAAQSFPVPDLATTPWFIVSLPGARL